MNLLGKLTWSAIPFDQPIVMAATAMMVLTIVSILLLPAGVIAGFMGMNIKAPYSNDNPVIFWFVVSGIAIVAALTLLALRARRWL